MDDYWYAICYTCGDGIANEDDEYAYGVHPITGEEYYVHDMCRDGFHADTLMGFCDLCDGTTWLAGYHTDAAFDTDPVTGNHVTCEREYMEHHKEKDYCFDAQCEWHQTED